MHEHQCQNIKAFFRAIEPFEGGYQHRYLSYLAIRVGNDLLLSQGRYFLQSEPPSLKEMHFASENVLAGHYKLDEASFDVRQWQEDLLAGSIMTPQGRLIFPPEKDSGYSASHTPLHSEGLKAQNRISTLVILGATQGQHDYDIRLDWEVMAAPLPYANVKELMLECRLGTSLLNRQNIEFVAFNVAGFDASSRINGTRANVVVNLAKSLKPEDVRVGYRVFSQNQVVSRERVNGEALEWCNTDIFHKGAMTIEVPAASVIHGFLSYAGVAQQHLWIADPDVSQNSRRATYEAFDSKLDLLKEFLQSQGKAQHVDRDLEAGVAWLLWMLGFNVVNLACVGKKMSDAPDLIATTPSGHFAVIECTTGLLKAESKLQNLIDRTEAVRRRVDASNNRHLKVMPVIVSSKTRDEIRADLEQAERLGVLVLSREDLLHLADVRTLIPPNADVLYAEAEQTIRTSQEQNQLPLQTDSREPHTPTIQ